MTDTSTSIENSQAWAYQQLAVTVAGMGDKAAASDMARITGHIAVPVEEVSRLLVVAESIVAKYHPSQPDSSRPLVLRLRTALDGGNFTPEEADAIMALANGSIIEDAPVQQVTLSLPAAQSLVELAASAPAHRLGGLPPRVVVTQRIGGPSGPGLYARIEGMPVESEIPLSRARLPVLTAPRFATTLNSLRSAIAEALASDDPEFRESAAAELDGSLERLCELAVMSIDHATDPKVSAFADTLIDTFESAFEAEWDRVSALVSRSGADHAVRSADRAATGLALLTIAPMIVDALANGSLPSNLGVK